MWFEGKQAPQQINNVCITFEQCRPNVFDVGPTLYKCYTNVLCLLECVVFYLFLNIKALEVVSRNSETQLQVGENLNWET